MNPRFTNIQEDGKWKCIESFFHPLEKLYLYGVKWGMDIYFDSVTAI